MTPTPDETAASLEAAKQAVADAEKAHRAATQEAEENRSPQQATADLLTKLVDCLGNQPAMEKDLKVITKPPKP